jgi:hypothetical protein
MQIEESFRDQKSQTYGLGSNAHQSYKKERLKVLLMLAALPATKAIHLCMDRAHLACDQAEKTLVALQHVAALVMPKRPRLRQQPRRVNQGLFAC